MYRNEGSVEFASLATKSEGKDGKKGVGGGRLTSRETLKTLSLKVLPLRGEEGENRGEKTRKRYVHSPCPAPFHKSLGKNREKIHSIESKRLCGAGREQTEVPRWRQPKM